MKNAFLKSLIASVVAVFGFGLLFASVSGTATTATDDLAKRDEETTDIVLVADDDDDNSRDGSRGSGVSRDATNSRFTGVSRDRDISRGDLTRDKTRDGAGGKKRDFSPNLTNDRTRNDTR